MPAPSPSSSPTRLTDRDRELLAFAAEHRFVLAGQVARLLDVSEATARRRLGALHRAGLLRQTELFAHEPAAYAATRWGLTAAGSDLSAPRRVDPGAYRHDVGVTWLAAAAHRGAFGQLSAVVGERRMRSEDRRADRDADAPRHGVRMRPGGSAASRLHYPDLVVVTDRGHRVAFELELSTKQPAHRERILSAYAADRRIDAVVYLIPTAAAARAIERSAAKVGARDLVRVQRFHWAGGRAPGDARRATRSTAHVREHPARAREGGR